MPNCSVISPESFTNDQKNTYSESFVNMYLYINMDICIHKYMCIVINEKEAINLRTEGMEEVWREV